MCDLHTDAPPEDLETVDANDFVDELVVCMTNLRIWAESHPRVQASLARLRSIARCLVERSDAQETTLGTADGYLFHDGRPLLGASLSAPRLIARFAALAAGGLRIEGAASDEEFRALLAVLRDATISNHRDANAALEMAGCRTLRFLPRFNFGEGREAIEDPAVRAGVATSITTVTGDTGIAVPRTIYQGVVDLLQEVLVKSTAREPFDLDDVRHHVDRILSELRDDAIGLLRLARYEQYDAYTFGHSIRVCVLALQFAVRLGAGPDLLYRIGSAALLHDVGKAWVPFDILHARGRLDPAQRAEMQRHSEHGGRILSGLESPDPLVVATAFGHHRTLDGCGYPRLPVTIPPSLVTRIVKVCDAFEALTAIRPYKPSMSPRRAYRIMMNMPGHFDPGVLRAFIDLIGIYPCGSRVRLNSGEIARVLEQSIHLDRPKVLIEAMPDGRFLEPEDRRELDLAMSKTGVLAIVGALPDQ